MREISKIKYQAKFSDSTVLILKQMISKYF